VNTKKIVRLSPPLLSENYIKEKIICIRGHRERLFNTSFEHKDGKYIFHNYGQGGAGWTFLFGCVHESISQLHSAIVKNAELYNQPITVIGAGCYGLLTAILLKRAGHQVTIIAKETHSIPSYKAAGFFFPRPRKVSNAHETEIFLQRGIESYRTYLEIIAGKHPFIKKGPKLLPAYYDPNIDPGFGPYIAQELMPEPQDVIIDFGNDKQYPAHEYQALFINASIMMNELQRNIRELQIPIIQKEISSFDEIQDQIIFNCSNLGAKSLANDTKIIPIQGHLISLHHQPIESLQYMINYRVTVTNPNGSKRDELIYFAPKEQGILGITFLRGQDSLTANQHEFDRLLTRSRDFFGT
jgi:hypothetical protein